MRITKTNGEVIRGNQLTLPVPGSNTISIVNHGIVLVETTKVVNGRVEAFLSGSEIKYKITKTDGGVVEGNSAREIRGTGGQPDFIELTTFSRSDIAFSDISKIESDTTIATQPLNVSFLSPAVGQIVTAQPYDVWISAENEVISIELFHDGVSLGTISTRTNNAFKYTWNTALPADGAHSFRAVGTNAGGTRSGEAVVGYTVAAGTSPLTGSFISPLPTWVLNNLDLKIEVATEPAVTQVIFKIDETTIDTVTTRNAENNFQTLRTGAQIAALSDADHRFIAELSGASRTGRLEVIVRKESPVGGTPGGGTGGSGSGGLPPLDGTTFIAEKPRVIMDTTFALPLGSTITVGSTGNLQNAINAAQPGQKILLNSGSEYIGNFTFPAKQAGAPIYVMCSGWQSLPAEGSRFIPGTHAGIASRIKTPNGQGAMFIHPGAHDVRFVGIEFMAGMGGSEWTQNIVDVGIRQGGQPFDNNIALAPTNIGFDRCWVHGQATTNTKRGIALNCRRGYVIDSYINDIHIIGWGDTAAIGIWFGPGPFKIVGNYLEAAGENVLFGGATPWFANNLPEDCEFRRNVLTKPTSWRPGSGDYAGKDWAVKNLLELKNLKRGWFEGNVLENTWSSYQGGFAVLITPRNDEGPHTWSTVQDIVFRNNVVRHAAQGFSIAGYSDAGGIVTPGQRYEIVNNYIDDIDAITWRDTGLYPTSPGRVGTVFQLIRASHNLWIEHNFARTQARIIYVDEPINGFRYKNNVIEHGFGDVFVGGVMGAGTNDGDQTFTTHMPGRVAEKNVQFDPFFPADNPNARYTGHPSIVNVTQASVGFTNFAGKNYRLAAGSPYKNWGTDGKDPGPDWAAIESACGITLP